MVREQEYAARRAVHLREIREFFIEVLEVEADVERSGVLAHERRCDRPQLRRLWLNEIDHGERNDPRGAAYNCYMYDGQSLQDIHRRAHESLRGLIAFCGVLAAEELRRPLAGFGFPTIMRQLEHAIGAEVYWQTVVTKGYTEEAQMPALPDLVAMEEFRLQTAAITRGYLAGASDAELNFARPMVSDPGETRVLRPADVIMRIVTHMFNHQGQVLAMCRTMGRPNEERDLDYPLN